MSLNFDGQKVDVIYSGRKTLAIQIKNDGILVRAPYRLKKEIIIDFLRRKRDWIEKQQKLLRQREEQRKQAVPFTKEELEALAARARELIPERVRYYAALAGVDYGRVTIRLNRSRWGSCSGIGNLNFNCLLMLFPDEVIDSVVVHELCHRKHMNHSASFYAEVERVFPEYQRCRKWLREHGRECLNRIPERTVEKDA